MLASLAYIHHGKLPWQLINLGFNGFLHIHLCIKVVIVLKVYSFPQRWLAGSYEDKSLCTYFFFKEGVWEKMDADVKPWCESNLWEMEIVGVGWVGGGWGRN